MQVVDMTHHQWPSEWDRLPPQADEVGAAKLLADCVERLSLMTNVLRRVAQERGRRDAKTLQRALLRSESGLAGSLAISDYRKGGNLSASELLDIARGDSLWTATDEPVWFEFIEAKSGKARPIFSFGVREYAKQLLALRGARQLAQLHPRQWLLQGGMKALTDYLELNLKPGMWVATTDMPSCFLVLSRAHVVADGLLPEAVMRRVLFEPMARAKVRLRMSQGISSSGFPYEDLLYGRGPFEGRSVPPGSALAALVAEARLATLLYAAESACAGVLAASYADNIIILASSREAANASMKALLLAAHSEYRQEVVEGLRDRINIRPVRRGFSFCGSCYAVRKAKVVRYLDPKDVEAWATNVVIEAHHKGWDPEWIKRRVFGKLSGHPADKNLIRVCTELLADAGAI